MNDILKNIKDKANSTLAKIKQGTESLSNGATSSVSSLMTSGKEFVEENYDTLYNKIEGLNLLSSIQNVAYAGPKKFDEKHYFLIPNKLSEFDFTLYSMRILPKGIPPVNDLQKKRFFHIPSEDHKPLLENMLLSQIEDDYRGQERKQGLANGDHLIEIANSIDKVESRITNGVLLLGGLVAIANPLMGVGIAAHALIPGIGGALSKYGLKWSGEKINSINLEKKIAEAKADVLSQFHDSETQSIVNPLLMELQRALDTTVDEHDPMSINVHANMFDNVDTEKTIYISSKAILEDYKQIRADKRLWGKANLGPEDIKWLNYLETLIISYEKVMSSREMNHWEHWCLTLEKRFKEVDDVDNLAILHQTDEDIHRIAPIVMRKDALDSIRYDIERIMYKLLPELIEQYMQFSNAQLYDKTDCEGTSPHTYFIDSFRLLTKQLHLISEKIYEKDARSIRILCKDIKDTYRHLGGDGHIKI